MKYTMPWPETILESYPQLQAKAGFPLESLSFHYVRLRF